MKVDPMISDVSFDDQYQVDRHLTFGLMKLLLALDDKVDGPSSIVAVRQSSHHK